MNKFCITFAGPVGSSKSPIANFLSYKLNLPVYNNDCIRTEVLEDLGTFDEQEYLKRRDVRGNEIINSDISFIYDASVDREWGRLKQWLIQKDYRVYIISLDFSIELLKKLYVLKNYTESINKLDEFCKDHETFLANYNDDIGLHITDSEFDKRLELSYTNTKEWISSL